MSNKIIKPRSARCISEIDDYYGYAEDGISEIIDSLNQEQSEVDLEESIKNICDFNKVQTSVTKKNKALNHFYELMLNTRKEK